MTDLDREQAWNNLLKTVKHWAINYMNDCEYVKLNITFPGDNDTLYIALSYNPENPNDYSEVKIIYTPSIDLEY